MTKKSNNKEYRIKVSGNDVINKVKDIIEAGNARSIIIENEKGNKIMEFTLTIGAVATILAPILAALGALTALATKCTIVVEKRK